MSDAVLAAIIGAVGTVLAGGWAVLITVFLRREKANRMAESPFASERRKQLDRFLDLSAVPDSGNLLENHWVGLMEVRDDPERRKYRGTLEIEKVSNRELTGCLSVVVVDGQSDRQSKGWRLEFAAGFLRETLIRLEYRNPDTAILQFGTIILQKVDEKTFEGKFVAFGRDLGRLVYGFARLDRQT